MTLNYDMIQQDDNGHIQFRNSDFIIVNRPPYYDSLYHGHNTKEFYKAVAVRLGDTLDEDGFVPAYEFKWELLKDNSQKPCDWDNPIEVEQINYYKIEK